MKQTDLTERKLDSELIYKGKILDLYRDTVQLPNGETGKREYIKHIGAAAVVPVTEEGDVLLVKQFRYPFSDVLEEIPAGKLDTAGEAPLTAAKRELQEETGCTAETWVSLGEYYPTCAYSDEVIHLYLATGLTFGEQHLDEDEFIRCGRVALQSFVDRIMAGEIKDGKTQTAVLKAYYYLNARQE